MIHVDALSCLPWRAGPSTQRVLARRQAGWVHARRPRHEEAPRPAGPVTLESGQTSTTRLGDWYASAWAWRPQVALFVSKATLFPLLMPLAPAATLLARFPDGLAQALAAHDVPEAFITQELSRMQEVRLGKTASRSVLGIMNEFTFLAQTMRGDTTTDLTDLASWLARTPCSPLFKRHGSPDRELRALVEAADQETPTR